MDVTGLRTEIDVLQEHARQARGGGPVRGRREVQERAEPVHGDGVHRPAPRADGRAARQPVRQYVAGLQQGRNKTAEQVQAMIDNGPYDGQQALQAGLVDELVYEDQLRDRLKDGDAARPRQVRASEPRVRLRPSAEGRARLRRRRHHARARARAAPSAASSRARTRWRRRCARRARTTDIKAIVLRVDSPGGSGHGLRRDLARGRAGQEGQARHRLDGGPRRLRRLLHRHGRGRHRGPARPPSPAPSACSAGSSACTASTTRSG